VSDGDVWYARHDVLRRSIWFATAYTIVIVVHEWAHALTSSALGLETTLFHFWANIDPTNQATVGQKAAFGVAGPVSSLVVGVVAWLAYRRFKRSSAALPLLFLTAHGVSNFFGNLMSAAFIGDFSNVTSWLGIPLGVRYAMSATGALATASVLYVSGRQLARWAPTQTSRTAAALVGIMVPAAIGTALIILVNQPIPLPGFAAARIGEGAFWIFAAVGAFTAPVTSTRDQGNVKLYWQEIAIAVLTIAVVRIMALGVPLSR
jgi:hypothetical protein